MPTAMKFHQKLPHYQAQQFFLIAGPCVVESEKLCMEVAEKLVNTCDTLQIPLIFKASYRKANRSRNESFRGIGDQKALKVLKRVRAAFNVPVLTDIHETNEVGFVAEHVDILQIPAFLCRQSALLEAAGRSGKVVNIKKGQFLSPDQMAFAAEKVAALGQQDVWLTERGTFFGYQDLVVDFRSLVTMRKTGFPVVFDATHSLQQPNQTAGVSGGLPELVKPLARAAVAVGIDGLFLETHPEPTMALSDGSNMIPLHDLPDLLENLQQLIQN